jgi:FkbM family methyltransferase
LDLPDRQVEVCTVFGTQMRINPSDNSLERSVYVRGIYEVPLTSFLLSVLPRVKVFWDVGAHVGYHTLLGSHVIGPGGRVVAFEPHPRVFSLIEENVRSFGFGNVTLMNMGLSNEDSEKEIFDEGENVTRAPTFVEGIYERSGHRCRLVSGDRLLAPSRINGTRLDKPDLIKMDIEGYESNALMGITELLSSESPPILLFELNHKFNPDQVGILELLSSCNPYEFYVEDTECRYPIRRSATDGPVPGFVPLRIDDIPSQCNVLAYCADTHAPLIAGA